MLPVTCSTALELCKYEPFNFLQVEEGNSVLDTSAVQFCARKVSAMAGDMRKALDICRFESTAILN